MTDLPTRLSQGNTKVTFRARREDARAELKEAIDRKYVHVLFTETQGGTELGFQLDEARSELTGADWERGERSEEHTSELQSQSNLVCRLLLEKKKIPLVMK